ncbi:MAG: hypothetical protein II064_01520 [Bacteroidales bacterium]|nr:hypothetical protein [Bacteroidales bacterium]
MRKGSSPFTRTNSRNPKFTEREKMVSIALPGVFPRAARQNCLTERGDQRPKRLFRAQPRSAKFGITQNDAATEWGTGVAIREHCLAATGALVLEEVGMFQGAAHEGAKPHGIRSHLSHPPAAVGHLEIEGNEIEPVIVFPLIEVGIDFRGVPVEQLGVEQLLLRRHFAVCLEEIVLFHGTDFF